MLLTGGKIEFKEPMMETQFQELHPACRAVLVEVAAELPRRELRHALVSDLIRSPETQRALYGLTGKFSWHLVGCAFDLRVRNAQEERYTDVEALQLKEWLQRIWPQHEVLLHGQPGVKDNLHLHFGWRDAERRRIYEDRLTNATTG